MCSLENTRSPPCGQPASLVTACDSNEVCDTSFLLITARHGTRINTRASHRCVVAISIVNCRLSHAQLILSVLSTRENTRSPPCGQPASLVTAFDSNEVSDTSFLLITARHGTGFSTRATHGCVVAISIVNCPLSHAQLILSALS